MKRILCTALIIALLSTPALAAKLYLKDGGVIQARRVWRSDGKVYVLATRDTMTSFEPNEVNLKKTFPHKQRKAAHKRARTIRPLASHVVPTASAGENTPDKTVEKKNRLKLPSVPSLPEKSPESLVPSSGSGGAIKQHKKEMRERLEE